MRRLVVLCGLVCRVGLGLAILSAGGCLALMARGAAARQVFVTTPCKCGWADQLPVAGTAAPAAQDATGPR